MLVNWSKFVWKAIWFVGLVVLAYLAFDCGYMIKEHVASTYDSTPFVWFSAGSAFLFGMYLSLLFVKRWSFQVNLPLLLCVCIPCLLLTAYYPIVYTFDLSFPFDILIAPWLWKVIDNDIVSIVAGFTLLMGLFGATEGTTQK
ncbi:hypothetical protein [Brevibacillus sp. NRS-1366]|uniref:hypothetical protein n=1 Tax=Brevibacillus sp. NRS-1366 TaxID=3233899 RepID=UPI003D21FAAC